MRIHVPQPQERDGAGPWRMRDVIVVAAAAVLLTAGIVAAHGSPVVGPAIDGPAITMAAGNGYPEFTAAASYVPGNPLVDSDAAPPLTPVVVDGSTAMTSPADRGSAVEAMATVVNHSLPVNLRAYSPRRW